jgi:hypothetical protein
MLFNQSSQPRQVKSVPFQEVQSTEAFLGRTAIHWDHTERVEAFLESVGGATRHLPGTYEFGYYAVHIAIVELIAPRWALSALQELIKRCGSELEPTDEFRHEWEASGLNIEVFRAQRKSFEES